MDTIVLKAELRDPWRDKDGFASALIGKLFQDADRILEPDFIRIVRIVQN